MSSIYMRQILESIEQAQRIDEGYEDRVQSVVDWFAQKYPDGVTKKMFNQTIDMKGDQIASEVGATELKSRKAAAIGSKGKTGDSRKDFIKDVAAKMEFVRDTGNADAKRERVNLVLDRLMLVIDDAIGNAFPDGDPFDAIFPKARKMGVPADDMLAWLDRAVRKAKAGKSYHAYLRDVWSDYTSGNMGHGDTYKDLKNPW